MLTGRLSTKVALHQSRLPNTYTLSKSIAEHLLVARKGRIPLAILQPSIISASWRHPFPGWIDSLSAFAGFLAAYGNGLLRVIDADPQTILDVVPVDEVATRLIGAVMSSECLKSSPDEGTRIIYAAASLLNGLPIQLALSKMTSHFARYKTLSVRPPHLEYLGSHGIRFGIYDLLHQKLPLWLAIAPLYCSGRSATIEEAEGNL
ncbi:male sterility protein-domain-containing protein [Aspergillus floccosus]